VHAPLKIQSKVNTVGKGLFESRAGESRRNSDDAVDAEEHHANDKGDLLFKFFFIVQFSIPKSNSAKRQKP